jgi:hypothetical protein
MNVEFLPATMGIAMSCLNRSFYFGLVTFTLIGCGGPTLHPVEGVIKYNDGTPLVGGGLITFTPVDPEAKFSARGTVKEDGTFKMGTFSEGDGVPEGTYQVAIIPTRPASLRNPPPGWPPLDKKYANCETSELEYTVTPGQKEYNITVEK